MLHYIKHSLIVICVLFCTNICHTLIAALFNENYSHQLSAVMKVQHSFLGTAIIDNPYLASIIDCLYHPAVRGLLSWTLVLRALAHQSSYNRG